MVRRKFTRRHAQFAVSYVAIGLLLTLLVSTCSSLPTQKDAVAAKNSLDKEILYAQNIGVASTTLVPIITQEKDISRTSVPFSLFSSQPTTQYYANQTKIYQRLAVQVRSLERQATQQAQYQASKDVQQLMTILAQGQQQSFVETNTFQQQLIQVQNEMQKARLPRDFQRISQESMQATESLQLLGTANSALNSLSKLISTMKNSQLDTTTFEQQSKTDIQDLSRASTPDAFNTIISHLDAQIISAKTTTTQSIPYIGRAKLQTFQSNIDTFRHYGGDATPYQHMHNVDTSLLTDGNYTEFATQIDTDMTSIKLPLDKLQAAHEVYQLVNATKNWGHAHQYHDNWNGNTYDEAYEYWNGTLDDIQEEIGTAQSIDDYQSILNDLQLQSLLFTAEITDYNDHTLVDHAHQSDIDLMKHFNVGTGKVIVTSLISDEARIYQGGKLLRAVPVVTGAPEKPTPPGFTQIFKRQSPATFTAFVQDINSPFYYPATHINYAMEYHVGEYYYHDSWWRAPDDYGFGKKFPHYAPGANNMGTHGCINMSLVNAHWLWGFTAGSQPVYSIVY